MIVPKAYRYGGINPESASTANLLHFMGATFAGKAVKEEHLFGSGGGIAFGQFIFQYKGQPPSIFLGSRARWFDQYSFISHAVAPWGISVEHVTATTMSAARKKLDEAVDKNLPILLHVDAASLDYNLLPESVAGAMPSIVGLTGIEGDQACIDDRYSQPIHISLEELAVARNRQKPKKNELFILGKLEHPEPDAELVLSSLREHCRRPAHPHLEAKAVQSNLGLTGMLKTAAQAVSTDKKNGWLTVFHDSGDFFVGMRQLFNWIQLAGTGGSASRSQYVQFLEDAAVLLNKPALEDAAATFRKSAEHWNALADTLMPPEHHVLGRARELMTRQADLFLEKGLSAGEARARLHEELQQMQADADELFNQHPVDRQACFHAVEQHLQTIAALEKDGFSQLEKAVS